MCRKLHQDVARANQLKASGDAYGLERLAENVLSQLSMGNQVYCSECRSAASDFLDHIYDMSDELLKPLFPKAKDGKTTSFKPGARPLGFSQGR